VCIGSVADLFLRLTLIEFGLVRIRIDCISLSKFVASSRLGDMDEYV